MAAVCEIAAGVCDHYFVNCKERESNNINACVSSLLCIRDSFRSKNLQTRNMPLSLKLLHSYKEKHAVFPKELPQS